MRAQQLTHLVSSVIGKRQKSIEHVLNTIHPVVPREISEIRERAAREGAFLRSTIDRARLAFKERAARSA